MVTSGYKWLQVVTNGYKWLHFKILIINVVTVVTIVTKKTLTKKKHQKNVFSLYISILTQKKQQKTS